MYAIACCLSHYFLFLFFFFFFQAEDGIRDYKVTGVQTCSSDLYFDANTRSQPGGWQADPDGTQPAQHYPRRWGFMNWSQPSRTACLAASSSGSGPRPPRPPPPPAPPPAAAPPPIPGLLRVLVFSLNTPRTTMR